MQARPHASMSVYRGAGRRSFVALFSLRESSRWRVRGLRRGLSSRTASSVWSTRVTIRMAMSISSHGSSGSSGCGSAGPIWLAVAGLADVKRLQLLRTGIAQFF